MEEENAIIAVANQKGGAGKTTIAYHLSRLAAQAGKSVLVVDVDPQGNLTELFTEGEIKSENHTRLIFDEKAPVPLTVVDGIRLIGSDISLSAYEKRASWHDIGLLRLYLIDRPERLIIIDCPPNLGLMTSSALFCATRLLVPVTMGRSSVKGLRDLFATAKDLRDMGKDVQVEPLGIVLNAMAEGQLRAREARELLWQGYSALMLKTIIPQAASVEMAMNHKKAVWEIEPRGKAAKAFRELYAEIAGRLMWTEKAAT